MKDILVDQAGELRCPSCHGRNFDYKRTLKAKVTLGAVVLPAALMAKKRMKCLQRGEYAKTGNAQSWSDPALRPPREPAPVSSSRPVSLDGTGAATAIWVTGATSSGAVLAAQLRELMPSVHYDKRQRVAEEVALGNAAFLAAVPATVTAELLERMAAIGITAETR